MSAITCRDWARLRLSGFYYGMILIFALGAVAGKLLADLFGRYAIWASAALLMLAFAAMLAEESGEA